MLSAIRRFLYFIFACSLFYVGVYTFAHADTSMLDVIFSYISYPFLIIQNSISKPIKESREYFKKIEDLENQIKLYKDKYEESMANNIELNAIKEVSQDTKELRDFALRYKNTKTILTNIILKNFDDRNHFFLIDAGSQKGVSVDMVAVYKNCLIGRISQVYPQYSKVILITDRSCKVAANTSSSIRAITEGNNTLNSISLSYVNHLMKVKDGDLVLSSGEGLIFPKGFGLGKIKKSELEGFNYKISLEPLIDFKSLTYCYIIEKGTEIEPQETISNISAV